MTAIAMMICYWSLSPESTQRAFVVMSDVADLVQYRARLLRFGNALTDDVDREPMSLVRNMKLRGSGQGMNFGELECSLVGSTVRKWGHGLRPRRFRPRSRWLTSHERFKTPDENFPAFEDCHHINPARPSPSVPTSRRPLGVCYIVEAQGTQHMSHSRSAQFHHSLK